MKASKRMVAGLALVAILLLTMIAPSSAQSPVTRFNRLIVNQSLTSVGTTTLTGAVTTAANVTVGANLVLAAPSAATVTNGMTLTPAGSYQPLTAAGTVGFGVITAATAGTVLTLVNTANQTITITDTGTLKLAGNVALGQYDSVTMISDGTNWIETGTSNN